MLIKRKDSIKMDIVIYTLHNLYAIAPDRRNVTSGSKSKMTQEAMLETNANATDVPKNN